MGKTQPQLQESSQKELRREPPSGWRYYSPTDRSAWLPTGRQVLATIAIVGALVSLISLIGYFFEWWPVAGQPAWVIGLAVPFLVAMIIWIGIGYGKAERRPARVWRKIKDTPALAGALATLVAAVIGLSGILYQQWVGI